MVFYFTYESLINHPLYSDSHYKNAINSISFKKYIKINRDGNCFYYCIGIVFYNFILNSSNYIELIEFYKIFMKNSGFSNIVFETYLEILKELIEAKKTLDDLEEFDWLTVVAILKVFVASYLRIHEKKFKDFLFETDINNYIKNEIEPMGKRAGELETRVLSEFLNYQINTFYLNGDSFEINSIGKGEIIINLLFTPDHYELLISDLIK